MSARRTDIADAIDRMERAAERLPGSFRGSVALVCHGGVIGGAERWACEIDSDIEGAPFAVWAHTAADAVTDGLREAWRRVPAGADGYIGVRAMAVIRRSRSGCGCSIWRLATLPGMRCGRWRAGRS